MYLHHRSALGEFSLSSDSVMQTFTRWPALKPITEQLPESENEAFMTIAYTIGAMMVFPGNQIDRKWTINQARGCNRSISDRFDLTLECIRRHYSGRGSPLSGTLSRYADFFALFGDFRGYVSFFPRACSTRGAPFAWSPKRRRRSAESGREVALELRPSELAADASGSPACEAAGERAVPGTDGLALCDAQLALSRTLPGWALLGSNQ